MKSFIYPLLIVTVTLIGSAQTATQDAYPNFGEHWLQMSERDRLFYIEGFEAGTKLAILTFLCPNPPNGCSYESELRKQLNKKMLSDFNNDAISKVKTDLYKDPANSFIIDGWIYRVAKEKLEGKNIDELLIWGRKEAQRIVRKRKEERPRLRRSGRRRLSYLRRSPTAPTRIRRAPALSR